MRRALLSLGLTLVVGISANAQQPSQLELVRALRTAGMVDLAVQRLEELRAKPNLLTPDDVKLIPLELARIRLEEASRESDDARRASLIFQARGSFEEFIKLNATHPMAAQANVEIARLFALQAKGQLSKANRIENREAKALEFSRARPTFTTAYNRYQGAITNLENRLKTLDEKDPLNAELKRSKAQAELDAAVLQYELALTFIGDDERPKKGEGVDKAQKAFEKIVDRYPNVRIGFLASVWYQQCAFVNGEANKAVPAIEKFIAANRNNRDAADAVRLAGFFGIEHVYEDEGAKDTNPAAKFIRTEQAAQRWLQAYPEAKNTPEGIGARYRRGLMKEAQAFLPGGVVFSELPKPKPMPPMPKPKTSEKDKGKEVAKEPAKEPPPPVRKIIGISPGAKQLLEDANKIYKDIADTDNEYSDRAQRRRLINQLVILEAEGKGGDPPLKSINTLEQAYLAAQVQQARIYDLPKSDKPEAEKEKEEKKRIDNAVNYLERGLQRVTPKDPPREVFDAQMLLVSFLSKKDRAIEAAVLGEGLARNNPKMPKAAVAAALAVFAYNSSLAKLKEANGDDEAQESDVKRIVALASFAEKTWPNDGPTDAIRHVLAFYQANRDKDYEAAWKTHSRIGSGYSDVYQARREMAAAMFFLIRPEAKDPKYRETLTTNITKRAADFRATLAALEALQEPPATSPAYQAEAWAGAKTMQAQLYYMNGDYDKVDAVVKSTVEGLMKMDSLEAKKTDLAYTIRALKYNSLQGRAADFIRAKEFAKVGEVLAADLDALKKELKSAPPEETPGFTRMRTAQRSFLISAMSVFVQNKQVDQASEMLDALHASGGSLEQNVATMRSLNTTIQGQIETLTKEGKKADAAELAKSFTEFLDKIKGEDVSKLPNGVILFLGQGYGAVNQNAKAAELFDQLIKKPFEPNPKDPDAPAKHAAFIRQMEYMQARAYRQAGAQGGGKPDFDKATALMRKVVGDPVPPVDKPVPQGWGYRNIDIRKEYCALLEDQKFFGPAVSNWVKLTKEFVPGGLPQPVKFLGQRQTFVDVVAPGLDLALTTSFQHPMRITGFVDIAFKNVYPGVAERRNQQRQLYFDLFFEAQRCSARAYTTPDVAVKVKGGPDAVNAKLQDIGQRLFDLITKNDDVPTEVKEKIQDFLNEDRYKVIKKKFEELTATLPKAATP